MNEDHFLRAIEKGEIEEAERILDAIKSKIPRTRFLYYEGMVLDAIGEPEDALKKFNMALVLHLSDPSIWLAKARVLQELGKMDMARRSVDRACRLSSENPSACLLYAEILYKMKDHKGASVQVDRAMEMAPDDPEILTLKGILVSILEEDYIQALGYFDKAINSDADHAPAWTNRGVALRMIGDQDGAVFSFQKALILDSDEKVAEEMLEHMGADDVMIPRQKRGATKKRKRSKRTRLMLDEAPRRRMDERPSRIDDDELEDYMDEEPPLEEEEEIEEEEEEYEKEYEEEIEDEDLDSMDDLDDEWEDEEDDNSDDEPSVPMKMKEVSEVLDEWDDLDDLEEVDGEEIEELEEEVGEPDGPIVAPPPKKKMKTKKPTRTLHLDCPKCSEQFDVKVKGRTKFSCPSCGLTGEIE